MDVVGLRYDTRAAQDRNSAVVNARMARCTNFEFNFMDESADGGSPREGGSGSLTTIRVPPSIHHSQRFSSFSIASMSSVSSMIGFVM